MIDLGLAGATRSLATVAEGYVFGGFGAVNHSAVAALRKRAAK